MMSQFTVTVPPLAYTPLFPEPEANEKYNDPPSLLIVSSPPD
jgi:hypothetical protein